MERREFIESITLGITGLVLLIDANTVKKDPTIEIKKEIERLMERTNTSIQYRSVNGCQHTGTSYFNAGGIFNADIPLPKLREIKARLEIYSHPDFYILGEKSVAVFYSENLPIDL